MLTFFLIVIIIAMAIAIGVVLAFVVRAQNKSRRQVCRLEISNTGNVRSRYELKVEDTSGALDFRLTLNGANLPQKQVLVSSAAPAKAPASPAPAARPAAAGTGGVMQKVGRAKQASGTLAYFMGVIGSFLPRSIGAPLIQASYKMTDVQYKAYQMERVSGQVGALRPGDRAAGPATLAAPETTAAPPAPSQTLPATMGLNAWSPTPFVEPDQTLALELTIDPARVRAPQPMEVPFQVMSRSLEQENAPWVVENGIITVAHTGLGRYLPLIIAVVGVVLLIILSVLLCSSTGFWGR
jgi:hypothetical protein